ncbi:MAG TPA: hypothetical protein VGJ31_15020, partial [Dongiaceae bacterium]
MSESARTPDAGRGANGANPPARLDSTDPIISVRSLVTRFGKQVVHNGLDLDVRRGEVLGV